MSYLDKFCFIKNNNYYNKKLKKYTFCDLTQENKYEFGLFDALEIDDYTITFPRIEIIFENNIVKIFFKKGKYTRYLKYKNPTSPLRIIINKENHDISYKINVQNFKTYFLSIDFIQNKYKFIVDEQEQNISYWLSI